MMLSSRKKEHLSPVFSYRLYINVCAKSIEQWSAIPGLAFDCKDKILTTQNGLLVPSVFSKTRILQRACSAWISETQLSSYLADDVVQKAVDHLPSGSRKYNYGRSDFEQRVFSAMSMKPVIKTAASSSSLAYVGLSPPSYVGK